MMRNIPLPEQEQDRAVIPPHLVAFVPIAKALVGMFGRRCEVVIHDLSNISSSENTIVDIQGTVTGRRIGGPPTDYLLKLVRSPESLEDYLVYSSRTEDGRPLRSATVFVRDCSGRIVGTVCVNLEMMDFLMAKATLESLCGDPRSQLAMSSPGETFARDANQTFESILQAALRTVGKPIAYMDKQEKVRLVAVVEEMGAFLLRGGAERLARALNVSRPTVYNYLNESKSSARLTATE